MVPNGPDHHGFDNKWSGLVWSNLAGKNDGLIWSGPSGGPLRIFRTGPALNGLVRLNGLKPCSSYQVSFPLGTNSSLASRSAPLGVAQRRRSSGSPRRTALQPRAPCLGIEVRSGHMESTGPPRLTIIHGERVVVSPSLVLEPGYLLIQQGRIVWTSAQAPAVPPQTRRLSASLVVPGFVDIHTHGIGGGEEVSEYWLRPEYTLERVVKYGTTAVLATMVIPQRGLDEPAAPKLINPFQDGSCVTSVCACGLCIGTNVSANVPRVAKKLNSLVGRRTPNAAVLEGIHAEGPIVATLGGLPQGEPRMSTDDFAQLLRVLGEGLRIMTLSPSLDAPDGYQKTRLLQRQGVRVALGHDKECTAEDILGALRLSDPTEPFHITHGFNVMRFHHRDMGLANFAMAPRFPTGLKQYEGLEGRMPSVELIGDCAHVDALVLQTALAARQESGGLCFVTDGIAEPVDGLELSHGAGRTAKVVTKDGIPQVVLTTKEQDGVLIGSSIMMLDAFRTAIKVLGTDVRRAVDLCCTTPAKIAGLKHLGTLEQGKRGDVVLLSESLEVKQTVVGGEVAHSATTPS